MQNTVTGARSGSCAVVWRIQTAPVGVGAHFSKQCLPECFEGIKMTSLELYRKVRLPSVFYLVIIVVCNPTAYYHSVLQGPTSLRK